MKKCVYDYENSCTCAEDDKCGCDYDNNMAHDVACYFKMQKKIKNSKQHVGDVPQNHQEYQNE